LGHGKKTIFHPLKNDPFFALFEKRQKSLFPPNIIRPFINFTFFTFASKRVKNTLKKNIASNLPWITDLKNLLSCWWHEK